MSRKDLYKSKAWDRVRHYIWIKQNCLCARCNKPVYVSGLTQWLPKEKRRIGIVHHKIYLNEMNYTDDDIAFNEDNLEGICIDCHNKLHHGTGAIRDGLKFDEFGNIIEE